jgi:hypothetical protein
MTYIHRPILFCPCHACSCEDRDCDCRVPARAMPEYAADPWEGQP